MITLGFACQNSTNVLPLVILQPGSRSNGGSCERLFVGCTDLLECEDQLFGLVENNRRLKFWRKDDASFVVRENGREQQLMTDLQVDLCAPLSQKGISCA